MDYQKYFKKEYIVLFLFLITAILYININKVPMTHPGNIKAADPFYHTIAAEMIKDTNQWNYYDYYISLGQEKASSVQPPLYYMNAAILSLFSGAPAWVTMYFLIILSQAMCMLITYLISKEMFSNESISIIASCLTILPLPVHVWLYGMYIGLWLQIISFFFVLSFMWLLIRFVKKYETWPLFFMSLCISSIILVHPQDLGYLSLPALVVAFMLIKKETKNFTKIQITQSMIKKGLLFSVVPLLVIAVLLPKFLFVWGAMGGSQFELGYDQKNLKYFNRDYSGGLVYPDLFFLPKAFLIVIALGIIQLSLNFKKYYLLIGTFIYYLAVTYLSPFIFMSPYYFTRIRAITPYVLFPIIAYTLYYFVIRPFQKKKEIYYAIIAVICVIAIGYAYPQYTELTQQMQGELISKPKWDAYTWIMQNTHKEDTVLFMGGVYQAEAIYSKRASAFFPNQEFNTIVNSLSQNVVPTTFQGDWNGITLRSIHKYEISYFKYEDYPKRDGNLNIYDFDYLFFQNLNPQITQINAALINDYMTNKNFRVVYNNQGYIILQNGNDVTN